MGITSLPFLVSVSIVLCMHLSMARTAHAAASYTYDTLNRLKSVTQSDGSSITYTYDATGNVTGTTRTGATSQTVNGVCGSAHGGSFDTTPMAALCTAGTASAVVGGGPWSWLCQGSNGGATIGCSAVVNHYSLQVILDGNGKGIVTSIPTGTNPVGISCTTGTCSTTFPFGADVVLTAVPDDVSVVEHWSGDCTASGASCQFTVSNVSRSVTTYFAPSPRAMIGQDTYATLASAYAVTQPGVDYAVLVLFTKDAQLAEQLTLDRGSRIVLKGGYKAGFLERNNLPTILKAPIRITSGRLIAEDIRIR